MKTNKPNELIREALVRGLFMEKVAIYQKRRKQRDEYFLVGLFSLAEAIMDAPMEVILQETHLADEITEPLITGQGVKAELIRLIQSIERAQWEDAEDAAQKAGLSLTRATQFYVEAMTDANKLLY